MRKYHLYAAVLCSAAVLGLGGCSNKVDAATTLPLVNESRPVVVESEEPTSSAEETTVVETVSGTIESAEEQPEQAEDSVCLFGPATQMEDGRLSIDSQADQGYQGEVILNVSQESTYVLDAVSGLPIELSDIKDGDTIHAYIGPAMPRSLPPMTNATMIFANVPADFKVPDYVTVKSVVTDAASSQSVLTAMDGTEYTLADDCGIVPYLTRNIVTLDDLTQGRKAVVWSDGENTATRIMVFAE